MYRYTGLEYKTIEELKNCTGADPDDVANELRKRECMAGLHAELESARKRFIKVDYNKVKTMSDKDKYDLFMQCLSNMQYHDVMKLEWAGVKPDYEAMTEKEQFMYRRAMRYTAFTEPIFPLSARHI